MRHIVSIVLFLFLLILVLVPAALILPYKEILECKADSCSVDKHYILKGKNYTYLFNRKDDIKINMYGLKLRFMIINNSENKWIFRNRFNFTGISARKVLNLIKSNEPYIKVYKYWFGYKIEG